MLCPWIAGVFAFRSVWRWLAKRGQRAVRIRETVLAVIRRGFYNESLELEHIGGKGLEFWAPSYRTSQIRICTLYSHLISARILPLQLSPDWYAPIKCAAKRVPVLCLCTGVVINQALINPPVKCVNQGILPLLRQLPRKYPRRYVRKYFLVSIQAHTHSKKPRKNHVRSFVIEFEMYNNFTINQWFIEILQSYYYQNLS